MTELTRHVEFNCATSEETWRNSTPEEHQQLLDQQTAYNAEVAAQLAQQNVDDTVIKTKATEDTAYAALARRLGLID